MSVLQRLGLRRAAVLSAAVLSLVPALVFAQSSATEFTAVLAGGNEVPAVTSTATGQFTATLDAAGTSLSWTLSVPSITAATASHIHLGAAGTTGPVVVALFVATQGQTVSSINASGTATVAELVGPLEGDMAGFLDALASGELYVNVHTLANPGGEIRGPVVPAAAPAVPAAPAVTPPASGNAGLLATPGAMPATTAMVLVLGTLVLTVGARAVTARRRAR